MRRSARLADGAETPQTGHIQHLCGRLEEPYDTRAIVHNDFSTLLSEFLHICYRQFVEM
jgi:hypothetical protein